LFTKRLAALLLAFLYIFMNPLPGMSSLSRGDFLPFWQADVNQDGNSIYHYVQSGDNLWRLARKYDVTLDSLLITNSLSENSILKIGDKIKIPSSGQAVHVIAQGETVWDIARKFAVDEEDITKLNGNINPSRLKIGSELVLPATAQRQLIKQPSRSSSLSNLAWPLSGIITSGYGWRKNEFHHGLDIAGDVGNSIRAADKGIVHKVAYHNIYGRMIIINHDDGKQTLYAHASKIKVKKGQRVYRGQIIGEVGITGKTTGPHLHFEVRINDKACNPLNYLNK
jgi:murein DD-endopeptidase MepM/ murein hydrolase activator NlpD